MSLLDSQPFSGSGIGSEVVGIQGNITVWNGKRVGFRYRARHDGALKSVSVHVKGEIVSGATPPTTSSSGGTYGWGNRGNLRARVYGDNGSGSPDLTNEVARSANKSSLPSDNTVLTFDLFTPGSGTTGLGSTRFTQVAGQRYHVLFENDAANNYENFSSLNYAHCRHGPRMVTPREPWSPYFDDEISWAFMPGDTPAESPRHQPSFHLEIEVSNPVVHWGPINMLTHTNLEQATGTAIGGIYQINAGNGLMLRQKFAVPKDMTISKVRIMPAWFGPSSGTGNLLVKLKNSSGTVLATATYTPADGMCVGSTYKNPWSDSTAMPDPLQFVDKNFSAAVDLLESASHYYLEFSQASGGNITWFVAVHEDAAEKGYYDGRTDPAPESWAPTAALSSVAQAEWSKDSGSSWQLCSIWSGSTDNRNEVRARIL